MGLDGGMIKIAKTHILNIALFLFLSHPVQADTNAAVHHLVVVWLKADQPNASAIYREASLSFADLPGVIAYKIAARANIERSRPNPAVDDSFDLIVDSQFESVAALEAFLKHPHYVRIAQDQLRPLVDHYRVYDFVE